MSVKDDGGPVFQRFKWNSNFNAAVPELDSGISVRDYFAAHAGSDWDESCDVGFVAGVFPELGEFPRQGSARERTDWFMKADSLRRYLMADAMLKAREK